jgi:hypothetical protein
VFCRNASMLQIRDSLSCCSPFKYHPYFTQHFLTTFGAPAPPVLPSGVSRNRYSVVPVVTRTLKEDDQLEGKTVPAGTMIVCHLQVRHARVCRHMLVVRLLVCM